MPRLSPPQPLPPSPSVRLAVGFMRSGIRPSTAIRFASLQAAMVAEVRS